MKNKTIYIAIIMFIFLSSCEKTAEWYMGFDKQPKFFDGSEYSKVINVFGILRPASFNEDQQSFVRVEKTVSSREIEFLDSLTIKDAFVVVSYSNEIDMQTSVFNYETVESKNVSGLYLNNNIEIEAGRLYKLECSSFGYDTVFAATHIPNQPNVLSINREGNILTLEIESDASAFFYEAICNSVSSGYVTPTENKTVLSIEINPLELGSLEVMVYAYDENLASYFSDVTSSLLNLNSFRAPYTTVDGGYGCFGSLNYTSVMVD